MKRLKALTILLIFTSIIPTNAAHVIKKEDAALFKRDSIYSEIDVGADSGTADSDDGNRSKDAEDRFSVVTASKDGDTYSNQWSNYKLTLNDEFLSAKDVYDFYADGMKFDFGIYFRDYSRIAIYYTRLSRDLSVVAANFAPGAPTSDVVIAGETYKHVSLDVPYPYGVEKYEYYFRNIDGKLMVIELYYEEDRDICKKYIDKIQRIKE